MGGTNSPTHFNEFVTSKIKLLNEGNADLTKFGKNPDIKDYYYHRDEKSDRIYRFGKIFSLLLK